MVVVDTDDTRRTTPRIWQKLPTGEPTSKKVTGCPDSLILAPILYSIQSWVINMLAYSIAYHVCLQIWQL